MLEHGGRLGRAAREYGIPREAWLDLSTGVSPYAWPVPPVPPSAWHRLPEDDDGLLETARAYYGSHHLLPVAGSQAAIAALPRLRPPSRVAIVDPGYAEHAHAWRRAGHDVTTMPMDDLLVRANEFDVVVLIRPNNPTGGCPEIEAVSTLHALIDPVGAAMTARDPLSAEASRPDSLAAMAAPTRAVRYDGPWLVVDEAFIDAHPERSLAPYASEGLVILRSVGKFFGLAGARAGFVVAWPELLDALAEALGPWTLTGPTRYVVAQAFADRAWHASAREWLRVASSRLAALLTKHGLPPSGGCEFFQYCVHPAARALHRALAERAILVRHFDTPQALRFGLPGDEDGFARLDDALARVLA
ncbi:threonine-phosphate decarboxylase [Luteibacter yeojuensis]|uniref:Aminotransferase n=1 Tax=Luteibacter yeojuensis TaxID=345309 RepID=A0A7X5QY08_9GAMM|nr:threonine-phosphate decarboxylase [Luteibacter yeojuensis]NID17397.1 aminotransferase class I/II-fold pyridoxal phosphate-dependent enzyme [Luteibacter yeojuensis]